VLFSFAGLWEEWPAPGGDFVQTCTIITTEPNELAATVHNRMPAILKRADEALLLAPYPDELEVYPVARGECAGP
jgi:putative SOS response-associated peptidase YedK